MTTQVPLLLLSGMAADERLFHRQQTTFPNLRVPAWIAPLPEESLRAYALRLARRVDPGCPCLVGGASFGGMVALEMAQHLQARACLLIGSVRSSAELPWQWRALRLAAFLGPDRIGVAARLITRLAGPWLSPGVARRLRRFAEPGAGFVRWAACAVLGWWPSPAARRVRVFQIHGEADRTLPVHCTRPDVIVPAGGHALPLTSPAAVNAFLRQSLAWLNQANSSLPS